MMGQSSILLVFCAISGSLAKPPPTFLEYKDSLGQYSFGYSAPGSARSEVRSIDGSTRGSYSYVDGSGNIQSAQYTADGENGFQIVATNLPQAPRPVEDTPEVAAARFDHLKALEAASKLAEEKPEENEQRSAVDAEKSVGNVESVDEPKIQGNMEIEGHAKSVKSPEAISSSKSVESQSAISDQDNEMEIQAQIRSSKSPEAMAESSSAVLQSTRSNEANEAVAKSAAVENQSETMQILDKPSQDGSIESNQPQTKSVEVSSRSDVPVVTTSFVIPGSLNLHTRIQLDQFGEAAARIAPESSSLFVGQPQGANPSILTPAGTRTMEMTDSEETEIPDGISSLHHAPLKTIQSFNQPQQYTSTIVPGVIAPSNIYAYTYGIGIDPIYRQYNPYQYFPYGIL